jgi:hypothetical protein
MEGRDHVSGKTRGFGRVVGFALEVSLAARRHRIVILKVVNGCKMRMRQVLIAADSALQIAYILRVRSACFGAL